MGRSSNAGRVFHVQPQLDTFIQVAELGSFSKAASALYISPTAVIKQMNILESNLGITLFNRTHQGLTLTSAGQSLLSDARHIIRVCDEAAERARKANDAERNVIRIGSSPHDAQRVLQRHVAYDLAGAPELHPQARHIREHAPRMRDASSPISVRT